MTIRTKQNVAINLAIAFKTLAVALGDTKTINNSIEHLEIALDNGLFDYEATRHAIISTMDKLIKSVDTEDLKASLLATKLPHDVRD